MPINNSYDEKAVIEAIAQALETFYANLIAKIDELNIQKIMKRIYCREKAAQNTACNTSSHSAALPRLLRLRNAVLQPVGG